MTLPAPFPQAAEATPLTHGLDPELHEPMDAPLKLREPNEADVIVACGLTWGCGFTEAHRRLRGMNFTDFEFGASND